MHRVLGVAFDEDLPRARTGSAAEKLAVVRRVALILLRLGELEEVGIKTKRWMRR